MGLVSLLFKMPFGSVMCGESKQKITRSSATAQRNFIQFVYTAPVRPVVDLNKGMSLSTEPAAAAAARWASLDPAGLEAEVQRYREAVSVALAAALAHTPSLASDVEVALDDEDGDQANGDEEEEGGAEEALCAGNVDALDPREWQVPAQCIPVHANVTQFDWKPLCDAVQFDVIMMDPPWQLATANPTRGVSLGYSQLNDDFIAKLPVGKLQTNGLLFVWVINAKYQWTLAQFKKWGYTFVDEIVWVKVTNSRRLAKSHGFYLQHAKEVCLVARKGNNPPGMVAGVGSDVIFAPRRGQSQKPTEIYELIEALVPNGRYLEIFARKNNLRCARDLYETDEGNVQAFYSFSPRTRRDFWISLGNEISGKGLPPSDVECIAAGEAIPGARYGRAT